MNSTNFDGGTATDKPAKSAPAGEPQPASPAVATARPAGCQKDASPAPAAVTSMCGIPGCTCWQN